MHVASIYIDRRSLFVLASACAVVALSGPDRAKESRAHTPPLATAAGSPGPGTPDASPVSGYEATPAVGETRIRVVIGNDVVTGRLWDNATARDLLTLLPLTLTFRDFNNLEKISQLPRKLSTEGMPPGDDPVPTDIGYYAPTGDIVFYYGDVGYYTGIMRIGQFDGDVQLIEDQAEDFSATIERT
jgi:hypothetical protein